MMDKEKVLQFILKNALLKSIYYYIKRNEIDRGIIIESIGRLIKCTIVQEKGCVGNRVIIGRNTNILNTTIEFHGNNNCIYIGEQGQITRNRIQVYDDNNILKVGKHLNSDHDTIFALLEGGRIDIGDNCLFSYNVEIRNSDSHSLIDATGHRINISRDVVIEDNVWIAQRVLVLKGAHIKKGCVVGAGSLVTGHIFNSNSLVIGSPARIAKANISWDINRV